jgi:PIN domain
MKFDAITLDTNIFDENGLRLDEGLLSQLNQFKESLTEFVLSDIVSGELKRHLTKSAQQAKDSLTTALRKVGDSELLGEQPYWDILEMADKTPQAADAAQKRIANFMVATGCRIIPSDKAEMTRLTKMYFESAPPFEASGKKQKEFPDAIALITVEDWAKANNKKVLAITKDKGWIGFAETSDWIFAERDLAAGLELLQPDTDKAREVVCDLLKKMEEGEAPPFLERITKAVKFAIEDMMPMAEGESGYYYDADVAELTFHELTFLHDSDDAFDFQIVQASKDTIVARLAVEIEADAYASFSLQVRDEGEYIPVAKGSGEKRLSVESGVLLTLGGDFTSKPPEFDIDDVEFVDEIKSVNFGPIEVDWDPDDRYDE